MKPLVITLLGLAALAAAQPQSAPPPSQSAPAQSAPATNQAAPATAQSAAQPQSAPTPTQAAPQPACSGAEARQLDFWIGDWELSWPNPAKPGEILRGQNRVTRELDGCVIEENFSGTPAIPLRGRSLSTYNNGKWRQTWVDNQAGYIDLAGEFSNGQMVLAREITLPNGNQVRQRMVFKNIKPDSLDWSWERSTDGGKTWQIVWPIHYERIR
jgi:hypothetical protein